MSRGLLLLGAVGSLSACTSLTDADAFKVTDEIARERLCERCPPDPSLRHAPCPPEDGDPTEHVVFFALRSLDFAWDASTWDETCEAGMDMDCSDRPDGFPVLCKGRTSDPVERRMPHGIDNALAQSVLQPLSQRDGFSLDDGLEASLSAGDGGMVLIVDGWNRRADDPHVGVRLLPTQGTVEGGKPRWDGTDRWMVYAAGWDPRLPEVPVASYNVTTTGYVRDGQLVWDVRKEEKLQVFVQSRGAVLRLDLRDGVMLGAWEPGATRVLHASIAGVWMLYDAERQTGALAQLAGGCTFDVWCPLDRDLRGQVQRAPDMPLPGLDAAPAEWCEAISVGMSATFEETGGVGDVVTEALPTSCGGMSPTCS